MINQEEESKPIEIEGFPSREPNVEYVGVVHDARVPTERIIAGKRINSWKRTCWPPVMGCGSRARTISGSLAYMDFKEISLSYLTKYGHNEGDRDPLEFPHLGEDALMIEMFGIEPAEVERFSEAPNWIDPPQKKVLGALLNKLSGIAIKRDIFLLAIATGGIYNFYYGGRVAETHASLVSQIYNNQNTGINFKRFAKKSGNPLNFVYAPRKNEHLCLYGTIPKESEEE